jgi:hypothetical protein
MCEKSVNTSQRRQTSVAKEDSHLERNGAVVFPLRILVKVELNQVLACEGLASHRVALMLLDEGYDIPA